MTESKAPGIMAFDMDAKAEDAPDFKVLTFDNSPYPNEVLTYGDLVIKGRKLARAMADMGIGVGDAFSAVMRNHPEIVIAMYAASALRAILVPIDPRSKGEKLSYQIRHSNSKGILFSSEFMENVTDALSLQPDVRTLGVIYKEEFGVPLSPDHPDIAAIFDGPEVPGYFPPGHDITDPNMIVYTSGTTGDPKGIRRANILAGISRTAEAVWKYTSDDILYTGLSLTHGNAQGVTMGPALMMQIPAVISRRFTKSRIWDVCRAHGCTTFSLLGGMMTGIYSEPVRPDDGDNPVRKVLSAGTPRPIFEAFEKRFNVRIHEWYGAMEGGFAHNPPGAGPIGSFGNMNERALSLELRVVREDDADCDPGEIGELISRPEGVVPSVAYHGNPAASEDKTRGGWLRSGDMVHRDEEGWMFFDFRKGGGLRRQGDFIMPENLESVITEHPDVSDVCVFGIPASSGAPGESDLVAAIVPTVAESVDVSSIFDLCLEKLERNSVPTYLQVLESIPKTASEKNLSRILRDEFDPNAVGVYEFGKN